MTPMHPETEFVVGPDYVSISNPEKEQFLTNYSPHCREAVIWLVNSAAAFHKKTVRYEGEDFKII